LLVLFPGSIFLDETIEILVRVVKFLFEIGDMCSDTFFDHFRGCGQSIFLSDDHVEDLSSACAQRPQFQASFVGQRARLGTDSFGVVSDDRGIDAIGFSQLTDGFGKVSDMARVSHDHWDLARNQSAQHLTFQPAGGFQNDQLWPKLFQVFDQALDPSSIVSHRQTLCAGAYSDIELSFAYVNTDEDKGSFQQTILLDAFDLLQASSALRKMRAWITLATVRAFGEQGRDDPCYTTVCTDPGAPGLSRPFRMNGFHRDTLN